MSARSKAELMREHRARLRAAGLVKVECWVQPEERERLSRYVETRLGGFCPVGRQRTGTPSTAGIDGADWIERAGQGDP